MGISEINKEAFKEFSKIVLYCCNYSKRKVYVRHLKIMLGYYLTKCETSKLIEFKIDNEGVDIEFFDEYLAIMQKIGFILFDKNFYGIIIIAKKKLEEKAYTEYQLQTLREATEMSLYELQDMLCINTLPYSQTNETEDMI